MTRSCGAPWPLACVLVGAIPDPLQDPETGLEFQRSAWRAVFGNFGYSTLNKLPVNDVLWKRLGNTAILAGLAFLLIVPLSIIFGILSGLKEGGPLDRSFDHLHHLHLDPGICLGGVPGHAFCDPLACAARHQPADGRWRLAVPLQFVLPVAVLVICDFGYVARMIRVSMIGVMERPYIRTAILKGMSPRRVIMGHALRNAMIAPFTVLLLQINSDQRRRGDGTGLCLSRLWPSDP